MDKSFLYFIWEHEYFDEHELCSQKGQPIEIVHIGTPNPDRGPDFINARIRVGDTLRIGGVVINVDGSDWFEKKLSKDPDFSNIALHVTYRNIPLNKLGSHIPILELNGKISDRFKEKFNQFQSSSAIIACAEHLNKIEPRIVRAWQEQLITDSLESGIREIESVLEYHDWDWDITFLHLLIRNFDDNVNQAGFQALADSLDYSLLQENKNDLLLLESILFGQSGILEGAPHDQYTDNLKGAFENLTESLMPDVLDARIWKSDGLRPEFSPAVKLSQLATIIHKYTPVFSSLQEHHAPDKMLRSVTASEYWHIYRMPGVATPGFPTRITEGFASRLIISTYVPLLFAFGKFTGVPDIMIQAIEQLKDLKAQKNRKTDMLNALGVPCWNAADSLALLYAVDQYCLQKKCLQCPLGCSILGIKKGPRIKKELKVKSYIYN